MGRRVRPVRLVPVWQPYLDEIRLDLMSTNLNFSDSLFEITIGIDVVVNPLEEFGRPKKDVGRLPQHASQVAERYQPAELVPRPLMQYSILFSNAGPGM